MANNRLRFVAVDNDGNIVDELYFAKHFGDAWNVSGCYEPFAERFGEFADNAFINGWGIGLTDEYNDKPLTVVYNYNGDEWSDYYD